MATGGAEATGASTPSAISADGRYLAFFSTAPDLVPGDTNGTYDVFVRDRAAGTTERVSVATGGAEATGHSYATGTSADGRYIAFLSTAPDLVPDDTNGNTDVFVRDRVAGTTERVSVASGGAQAATAFLGSTASAISADGRYVAFRSDSPNLAPEYEYGTSNIFVHDRVAGTTEMISVAADGAEANGTSYITSRAISADGRYVAFLSYANNLVPGDTNGSFWDVFVRDRVAGTTERVSVATGGAEANGAATLAVISSDGRYVAFDSAASNLVPGDTNATWDIFVHDRVAGTTERVSVGTEGAEATRASTGSAQISADGRYVAFQSLAPNLVPGDTNGLFDIFVRDRVAGTTERVSVGTGGAQTGRHSYTATISPDGRYVAFDNDAPDLVPGDSNATWDVFVRDRGPALGVGDLSVTKASGELHVSGWAMFSGAMVASVADPPDDGAPGAGPAGAELTGASLTFRPEDEDLLVRLRLGSLPGPPAGGAWPAVLYGLRLELGGVRYEVRALRAASPASPPTAPLFALYRCDPGCTETARLQGGIGSTGPEVLVSVPLSVLGAQEGAALTGVRAFTALGEAAPGTLVSLDEADLLEATIPTAHVSLGIAPAGTPESEVAFDTEAGLTGGSFSGTLDAAALAAEGYEVWARACLGEACDAASRTVTLG